MFANCSISDLEASLHRQGVILDLSQANRLDSAFYYCRMLTCVPEIVLGAKCANASSMFSYSVQLHTIRKLTFPNQSMNVSNMFYDCQALESITIGGTIACTGLDLHWSTKLSRDSITSIVNALSSATSGLTLTLSQTAVNNAFTTDEWTALAATKSNWTISLA